MRPQSRSDFAIAIICALPLEADAVEALFDETYDRLGRLYGKQPGDANAYVNGRIREHDVVLCYMPRMGKGSAASVASSLRVSYTGVQLALVVGICGGVPYPSASNNTEIFLGDVIISDAVVEYDFGRQYPSRFQRKTDGHNKDMLGGPDREIRTLLTSLRASQTRNEFQGQIIQQLYSIQQLDARWRRPDSWNDILFESGYHHKHYIQESSAICRCFDGDSPDDICDEALEHSCDSLGCDWDRIRRCQEESADTTNKVSVHIGKIASADTVMKSGEHRDQIARKERVIGFEMEGAGVWDNIPCIIIKGVCDYADSHKNKNWQDYAAATAACGLKVFLGYYKIGKNTQSLVEQDMQVSINHLNEQSRTTIIFLFFAFLYFRGLLLTLHTRLTRLINPWSELPAILEDAHLRRFTIPLDTINTWEIFDFILEKHFSDMPGYRQVKTGSYVLEDSISRSAVKHTDAFKACFRPGRRVFMSMLFHLKQHEKSTCPSCHAANLDSGQSDVCCSFCGMQYRRIMEVVEDDNKNERHLDSANAKRLKVNPARGHAFIAPKTPAEADYPEEDVAQFKRVHIVAAPDTRQPAAGGKMVSNRNGLDTLNKNKTTNSHSSIPRPITKNKNPRISALQRHFEQLSREFQKEVQRERLQRAAESQYSRVYPTISSKPTVEVYKNIYRRPSLPAPSETSSSDSFFKSTYLGMDDVLQDTDDASSTPDDSIVNAGGLGERTLTPSGDGVSSRRAMVTRHDDDDGDGRHVTLRTLAEEEYAAFRERERRGGSNTNSRSSGSDSRLSGESSNAERAVSVIILPSSDIESEGGCITLPSSDISSMPPESIHGLR
ncbi:hypothetical protein TMatcc_002993 [Talaromyces marneffei ATCC 18224]|nr:uncharacterized protein EYB26_001934 [Talaromyces marneffei]KAE8555724.1 hypothetical protein EYB25_000422 [Talaromyces marneffei]QGA14281.1 hypothetical protein EYB26_001934 [Talaromyces marneffei]